MGKKARVRRIFGLVLLLTLLAAYLAAEPKVAASLHAANGFAAKWVCSEVFVTGLPLSQAMADLPANPLVNHLRPEVDKQRKKVSLSVRGLYERSAIFRPGFGCTLIPPGSTVDQLAPVPPAPTVSTALEPTEAGTSDDSVFATGPDPDGLDRPALDAAVAKAFDEPDPKRAQNTRAVVVTHNGRLLAERYADGIDADTVLTGWSMTKSWTNALVGLAVERGLVDIHAPLNLPEWPEGDPRRQLTLDHLLRMSSGLSFEESYANLTGDAVQMLFVAHDAGEHALRQHLIHDPDTRWSYSSGTTNLILRVLRRSFEHHSAYLTFPHRALFTPLGMTSAIIEPDPSGTFVGSSFGWATARDWARFGRLYLQDGVWNGERLLPPGWVRYTATPTPAAPKGRYGAQFWLNAGEPDHADRRPMPELPTDLIMCDGFQGQHVIVSPSYNVVIVRLGVSNSPSTWNLAHFLKPIFDALPAPEVDEPARVEAPLETPGAQ